MLKKKKKALNVFLLVQIKDQSFVYRLQIPIASHLISYFNFTTKL